MIIKCTPKELKELLQKETPVDGTTSATLSIEGKEIAKCLKNRD